MPEKGKNQVRAERAKRRADALRENLRRRKLQARSRATSGTAAEAREQPGPDSGKR
jgi:hypothetical protein